MAIDAVVEKVRSLPHKRSFYRFMATIIETSHLPTENHQSPRPYGTYDFTAESKAKIRDTLEAMVRIFNDTHALSMTMTVEEALEGVTEIWSHDAMVHERQALLPK